MREMRLYRNVRTTRDITIWAIVAALMLMLWGCGSGNKETVPGLNEGTEETIEGECKMDIQLVFDQKELYGAGPDGKVSVVSVAYADWVSTDYVDVSDFYALSYVLAAKSDAYGVTFFDRQKHFLCGTAVGEGREEHTIDTTQGSVIVPENAKYARFISYVGDRDPMKDSSVVGYTTKAAYEDYLSGQTLGGLKIACLGDSLTEGDYGLKPGVANVFYRNYPFYLAKMTGATTVNYGYCGITSTRFLEKYRTGTVKVGDADVVIVMLGTNAGLRDQHGANYETLIGEIRRDMKADAILVLVAPPHATEDPSKLNYGYNENVFSAVEFVRAFAAEEGIPLIDAYADSPIQPENEDQYQSCDGLHMNDAGYKAFAEFVTEELKTIRGK